MNYSYLIPNWFFGFDIGMEILFSVVAFLVAFSAFKISSITKERNIKFFGIAFLFIGISYAVWAGVNFWFVNLLSNGFRQIDISDIAFKGIISLYAYMFFFTAGLVTLVYITCGVKSGKQYYLLLGLSLLVIASSFYKLISFRILGVFLLSFIAYHYFTSYLDNKQNKKILGVFIAFSLILLSSIDFIFSPVYYQAYIIGHILELSAYLLILFILIKSVKK